MSSSTRGLDPEAWVPKLDWCGTVDGRAESRSGHTFRWYLSSIIWVLKMLAKRDLRQWTKRHRDDIIFWSSYKIQSGIGWTPSVRASEKNSSHLLEIFLERFRSIFFSLLVNTDVKLHSRAYWRKRNIIGYLCFLKLWYPYILNANVNCN